MRAAILAGVAQRTVPAGLVPALDNAGSDVPVADGTSCHADYATINQPACIYGDPQGAHTAVLVGDSQADMWLPAFDVAGKQQHWQIIDWTKSSCPMADLSIVNPSLHRLYTECDTWRQQTVARIAALQPDLVFVSDSEDILGATITPQQLSQATLNTLNTLRATSGAQVELVQDVPVPGFNLPDCVAAHPQDVNNCTFATTRAYSFPSRHRALAAAAGSSGYTVLDPISWICTSTTCPAIVANRLVYRDATHLSATFNAWLAPRVEPLLTARKAGD